MFDQDRRLLILVAIIVVIIAYYYLYYESEGYEVDEAPSLFAHMIFITDLLTDATIKYWILYDTLLGAVTIEDLLPYATDFSIGMYVEEYDNLMELSSILEENGYTIVKSNLLDINTIYNNPSLKILYGDIVVCNIYLYGYYQDGFLRVYDVYNNVVVLPDNVFHPMFVDSLEPVVISGRQFFAPIERDFVLKYWYGPDWNVYWSYPAPFYVWQSDYFITYITSRGYGRPYWRRNWNWTRRERRHTVNRRTISRRTAPRLISARTKRAPSKRIIKRGSVIKPSSRPIRHTVSRPTSQKLTGHRPTPTSRPIRQRPVGGDGGRKRPVNPPSSGVPSGKHQYTPPPPTQHVSPQGSQTGWTRPVSDNNFRRPNEMDQRKQLRRRR